MASLGQITQKFVIYGFFTVLIIGTIGSLLNLITFLSRTFRTNACTFYLTWSSLIELVFINFGIIVRFATEYFGNNLMVINSSICKVRSYLPVCLPMMASTCVLLAAFDRCVSTSPRLRWRQLSSLSFARYLFIVVMLIDLVSSSFLLIIFDLRNGTCAPQSSFQSIIVSIYTAVFILIIPHGGMLIFGIMTWIHIKQVRNRVTSIQNSRVQKCLVQRTNQQLIILTFLHAFLSTIIVSIRFITYSYNVITISVKKSVEQQQIEYFVQQSPSNFDAIGPKDTK
ncbi:unnamed protein product [Rotaria sp. Silwood2]|nr:unnamed protein product [Rotaria sp. Silwood2]